MIIPVRAFVDNYIWVIENKNDNGVIAVDPGDAIPLLNFLERNKKELVGVFLTHHHRDHTGGVPALLKKYPHLKIYASHQSPHAFVNHPLKDQDEINLLGHTFKVMEIPGHTLDHIAFYNAEILFSGDTLFSIGCGKVFEGTIHDMYQSLLRLRELPNATKIYCGHEYTAANLRFASLLEPDNADIIQKSEQTAELIKERKPTLPSTLEEEKRLNPFLRCEEEVIIAAVNQHFETSLKNPQDVFEKLREWKNSFS